MVLETRRVLYTLLAVDCFFVLIYLLSRTLFQFRSVIIERWINLDAEANIPTWFSGLQLSFIALLAFALAAPKLPGKRDATRLFYLFLSGAFLFLSMDEVGYLHESITQLGRKVGFHSPLPDGHGTWIFVYAAAAIVLAVLLGKGLREFLREPRGRRSLLTGISVLFLGAVVVEVIGYFFVQVPRTRSPTEAELVQRAIQVSLEEGAELVGQSFIIHALMARIGRLELSFVSGDDK